MGNSIFELELEEKELYIFIWYFIATFIAVAMLYLFNMEVQLLVSWIYVVHGFLCF